MVTTRKIPRPIRKAARPSGSQKPSPAARRILGEGCKHPLFTSGIWWGTDTETTGAALHHGCLPFFVSSCSSEGQILTWEWNVDPLTRLPQIPRRELQEVRDHITDQNHVWHNAKFDVRAIRRALDAVLPLHPGMDRLAWATEVLDRSHDTHIAGHILASSDSHKLKDRALMILDLEAEDQAELQEAVNVARRYGRKLGWRIAGPGDPHFPMLRRRPKNGWWPMDMWVPRAMARDRWENHQDPDFDPDRKDPHPFWTVCRKYAITDAERTIGLWMTYLEELEDRDLWDIYEPRRRTLAVTFRMEERGVSIHKPDLSQAAEDYTEEADRTRRLAFRFADHCLDNLNSPKQLQGALYSHLGLKPVKKTKSGKGYATDADTLRYLQLSVSPRSRPFHFIRNLMAHRKFQKATEYLDSYRWSSLAVPGLPDWWTIRPSYNNAGTATTRLASYDPNQQNISKQEDFNLRRVFAPLPGRQWWSIDYENIELRIFAYTSGDQNLIRAFEQGLSVHLVIGEVLHPKLFAKLGPDGFKKTDQYRWVKNGNFSLIYGASERKANATYRVPDAYQRIRKRLPLIDEFIQKKFQEGRQTGQVVTLGGYPLQVPPREPHKAANYFVQGSAGWAMVQAMVRVDSYLRTLHDHHLIMSIHDELDFDFPQEDLTVQAPIVRDIVHLMEASGQDLGLPTPVDVELIRTNWASGESVTRQDLGLAT